MRGFAIALSLPTLLLGVSCAGGGAPSIPLEPSVELPRTVHGEVTAGGIAVRGDVTTSAAALFQLTLDPVTGATSVEAAQPRSTQQTDDLFLLSLEQFFGPQHLQIDAVSWTTETVDIAYHVLHPFPAPIDSTAPASAINRADLGFAGMLLLLADVPSAEGHQFFNTSPEERIVAETSLVANADAYYRPAGLLDLPSYTANTFPYKLVVDEMLDPRTSQVTGAGIPNGTPVGNHRFDYGWRRSSLGPSNDGWTGYGVLHQGQASRNVLSLNRAALADGPVTLDLALIARYVDPRGGVTGVEKKTNRLPAAVSNTAQFVYREPHGALDVQRVIFRGESGGFIAGESTLSVLVFHVEDWDARAVETGGANLADDTTATKVAQGESGPPTLALSIPGVLDSGDGSGTQLWDSAAAIFDADTVYGGDAAMDSGIPGDALCYRYGVTKGTSDATVEGTYTGLVRAVDPEAALAESFVLELDSTLTPLAGASVPIPQSFQMFAVAMGAFNELPTVTIDPVDPLESGSYLRLVISAFSDPEDDVIYIAFDWNSDGDLLDAGEQWQQLLGTPPLLLSSAGTVDNPSLEEIAATVPFRVRQNQNGATWDGLIEFVLGPNRPPQLTGLPALDASYMGAPALFLLTQGDAVVTDPEEDPITYSVVNDHNDDETLFSAFPGPANTTPITELGDVIFTVRAHDPLHPGVDGVAFPPVVGNIGIGWARSWGGDSDDVAKSIVLDVEGNIYITGPFRDTDFGGGLRSSRQQDMFVMKLDHAGNYLWDRVMGSEGNDISTEIELDSSGNIYVAGLVDGAIDFGGGMRPNDGSFDIFILKLGADGRYVWDRVMGASLNDVALGLTIDPADNALVGGYFQGSVDFGGGTRPGDSTYDGFMLKLGPGGEHIWDRTHGLGNEGVNEVLAVASDAASNVYLVGEYSGEVLFGGGTPLISDGYSDICLVKYDPNGSWQWNRGWGGDGFDRELGTAITLVDNDPVVGGRYSGNIDFGGGVRTGGVNIHPNAFVVRCSADDGSWTWDYTYWDGDSSQNSVIYGLTSDTAGNIYFTGKAPATIDFGGGVPDSSFTKHDVVVSLTAGGTYRWEAVRRQTANETSQPAIDPDGNVIFTGGFSNTVDFNPGPGVFELVGNSDDIFVSKLNSATGRW